MATRGKFRLKDVDKGWKELRKTSKALAQGKSYVKAGVLGAAAAKAHDPESGLTVVELALVHEFGTSTIPARSWVRASFDKYRPKYIDALKRLLPKVYGNKLTVEKTLNIVGLLMVKGIKDYVLAGAGIAPPNSLATQRRKRKGKAGTIRPLVDTGRMLNSVQHQVVLSGTAKEGG